MLYSVIFKGPPGWGEWQLIQPHSVLRLLPKSFQVRASLFSATQVPLSNRPLVALLRKTDVDRSTAIINGTSQFYDQSVTKKYEVEAGPLTSDEAEWIDQLFTAYDVFRIEADATNPDDPYLLAPVLITDCTCKMQSGDEKLNIAKFTWRYADNRPVVHLSASPGIFTQSFNNVYC